MSERNGSEVTEIGEAKEKNFAEVLKLALSHATFENKDIGGYVYALLDSLAADQVYVEFEESDTTISIMSDLVDAIREELEDVAGRIDEDENGNGNGDDDDDDEDEIPEKEDIDDDDDDLDDDDDDLPEELGEVDEDDDDEIVGGDPKQNDESK